VKSRIAAAAVCLSISALIFSAAVPSQAQTRNRRTSTPQRRRPASPSAGLAATRFNAQRLELAGLSKDLTRFLYLYGRVSKDLELTAAQAESGDVAGPTKARLLQSVTDMRDRLDQLEGRFRFTKGLESQYRSLQGVSRQAETAAQNVSADRYDQAGRILLEVSNKLTDVLLEM